MVSAYRTSVLVPLNENLKCLLNILLSSVAKSANDAHVMKPYVFVVQCGGSLSATSRDTEADGWNFAEVWFLYGRSSPFSCAVQQKSEDSGQDFEIKGGSDSTIMSAKCTIFFVVRGQNSSIFKWRPSWSAASVYETLRSCTDMSLEDTTGRRFSQSFCEPICIRCISFELGNYQRHWSRHQHELF